MNTSIEVGPGYPGHDPLRSIPEPAIISIGVLGIALLLASHTRRRRIKREIKQGKRSPSSSFPV